MISKGYKPFSTFLYNIITNNNRLKQLQYTREVIRNRVFPTKFYGASQFFQIPFQMPKCNGLSPLLSEQSCALSKTLLENNDSGSINAVLRKIPLIREKTLALLKISVQSKNLWFSAAYISPHNIFAVLLC